MKTSMILASLVAALLTGCASETVQVSQRDFNDLQYFRARAMHTQGMSNSPTIVMPAQQPIIINNR